MDIGMRSSHPAATDHRVSIRGSRCTALIHAFAEEPSRWPGSSAGGYSDCGDGTWRLRSLLQGTRVTYVTEMFPFSRSLRVTSDDQRNWDPYQSATGAAPSSALCRPPDPSYKADDRTGLYTEKVNYCCSLSNPNSRTWITLGSVPFCLEEAHCGVTSSRGG